jgi:hypothetical protein
VEKHCSWLHEPPGSPALAPDGCLGGRNDYVGRILHVRPRPLFSCCRVPLSFCSRQLHAVLARKHRIGALLLALAVAACANRSPDNSLSYYPPSAQDPRDLALHIIEVDGDGEGDDVDMSQIERIETSNYGIFKTDISSCENAEEESSKKIAMTRSCFANNLYALSRTRFGNTEYGRLRRNRTGRVALERRSGHCVWFFISTEVSILRMA